MRAWTRLPPARFICSVGSCSSRLATVRAIASIRSRSRSDSSSQRPSFSCSTPSTMASAWARSAAIVGSTSSEPNHSANRWISSSMTVSARRASAARTPRLRSTTACRSSMSSSRTPASCAQSGSTSRGTAMSISSRARSPRARMTSASSSLPMIGCGEEVAATTMSLRSSSRGRSSKPVTRPPKRSASSRARSRRRLATNIGSAPWLASACAVSSLISPVPSTTTLRLARSPMVSRTRSTATELTETRPSAMPVSVRARLPVARAAPNTRLLSGPVTPASSAASYARLTCPWTSASPTIIDSNPQVTRNRCRAASQLRAE